MKTPTSILILFLMALPMHAQEFGEQRRSFAAANIGINGVVGGVGALINKKKDEKPSKVFFKGFYQGCLGGTFNVLGKHLTYQIKSRNSLSYAWPARLTNSIGNSITQNAASNINFWERWHFNLGLIRLDYRVPDRNFKVRLFPSALYGIIVTGNQARFSLKRTLQTGIIIFQRDGNLFSPVTGSTAAGIGMVSSIAINKNIAGNDFYDLMAHETMHILQYDNMIWINPFFNKLNDEWKTRSELYTKVSKYVYFDFNGLTIYALYLTQKNRPWICRYLEREAEHFSQRITLPDCN